MLNRILQTTCILLLAIAASAQPVTFLDIGIAYPFPATEVDFFVSEVIDDRVDKNAIGKIDQKEYASVIVAIDGFETGLKQYLNYHYGVKREKLIMVVEKFECFGYRKDKEKVTGVDVSIAFCMRINGQLKMINRQQFFHSKNSKINTKQISLRIAEAIDMTMAALPLADWDTKGSDYTLKNQDHWRKILFADTIWAGGYFSMNDLFTNSVADTFGYRVNGKSRFYPTRPGFEYSAAAMTGYWGSSDGLTFYINRNSYRNAPRKMIATQGRAPYIVWLDDIYDRKEYEAQRRGGLIGYAIAHEMNVFAWDIRTSEVFELTSQKLRSILMDYPSLLDEFKATEDKDDQRVIINFILQYNQRWVMDNFSKQH